MPVESKIELWPATHHRWQLPAESPTNLTVEWLDPAGSGSRLLARRPVESAGGELSLPVASGRDRILRFYRPGCAPHSFFLAATGRSKVLQLPACRPGGELFGQLPKTTFLPVNFRLSVGEELPIDSHGFFAQPGLGAGQHRLTPLYRGGLAGPAIEVEITAEETSELMPIPLPAVGTLDLALDDSLCGQVLGFDKRLTLVRRKFSHQGRSVAFEPFEELPVAVDSCQTWLEGLEPGAYELSLAIANEEQPRQVSHQFEIAAEAATTVLLVGKSVVVRGRVVTVDEEPFADLELIFSRRRAAEKTRVRTGADGEFEVLLPAPGRYFINAGSTRFLPAFVADREFSPGENELILELPAGVVHVQIKRSDGSELEVPVEVRFESLGQARRFGGFLTPDEDKEFDLVGLELDRYRITAATTRMSADESVTVELTERSPSAHAELVLSERRYRLRLVDPQGRSVRGSRVRAGGRVLSETPEGLSELAGAAPGGELRIEPPAGVLPVCRFLTREAEITVELRPATVPATVFLPADRPPAPQQTVGLLLGLPGSECPVGVSAPAGLKSHAQGLRLEIALVPGNFVFRHHGGGEFPLPVPGPPLILEPVPSRDPSVRDSR